jgi:hypothetical protein
MSPDRAFEPLRKEYRAAQTEIGKLGELSGRDLFNVGFGSPQESMDQTRGAMPKLIELDPELARSKAVDMGYGEGEASLIVRPGGDSFKSFGKSMEKSWKDDIAKHGMKDIQKVRDKQDRRLRQYLKSSFDPDKDSLIGLRHDMLTAGISDESFLSAVNDVFPDPANNEKLSPFNRNEVPRLSQTQTPGLVEIFRGLFKGQKNPFLRSIGLMRGKR